METDVNFLLLYKKKRYQILVLVSLFNGISTFVGYLKQKPKFDEDQFSLTYSWEDKEVYTLLKSIYPKLNVIAQQEFELAHYAVVVQHVSHYTTGTSSFTIRIRTGLLCWSSIAYQPLLFNAESSIYIYIKYIWFGWVGFYGISTIVGYLMSNPLYTYILNIYNLVCCFIAYQPF